MFLCCLRLFLTTVSQGVQTTPMPLSGFCPMGLSGILVPCEAFTVPWGGVGVGQVIWACSVQKGMLRSLVYVKREQPVIRLRELSKGYVVYISKEKGRETPS